MITKIVKLLNILDMSEMQQAVALYNLGHDVILNRRRVYWNWLADGSGGLESLDSFKDLPYIDDKELAHRAFELRDNLHYVLGGCAWDRACWEVWKYVKIQQNSDIFKRKHLLLDKREQYCYYWMAFWAKPIHQVIAALIVEEILADPDEKFDAHLTSECQMEGAQAVELPLPRVLEYGIAQENEEGSFGFWMGPNPSLEEMLEVEGRDKNSVIWRFNADGTDDLIYRWVCSEWMKVIRE